MSSNITPEELQETYHIAFTLHPREDVAIRVTMDACDYLGQLEASQARRERSATHWKAPIPREQLLQQAVYTVSYYREMDQESPRPLFPPFYQPTREDRIVRYVKHLIWKTSMLGSRSIAIGIGCLLYAYKPSEIADLLFLFDDPSLRTIKMRLAQDLRRRFANSGVVAPDGKSMRTTPASINDQLIIEEALKAFTPWGTDHLEISTPDKLILEMLLDEENPVSEWQRKHALIDPRCAGLARLINEYNEYFSSTYIRQRLADPRGNLMLPDFGGGPEPSLQRFKPRLLTDSDMMFLNERRKPSGPWAYLAEVFWLLSELVPMEDIMTEWPILINFCDERGPATIAGEAEPENHGHERIGYRRFWNEIQQRYGQTPTKIAGPDLGNLDRAVAVIGGGGLGQKCAASHATLLFRPLGTVPPLDSDDPQARCNEAHQWILFCPDVRAESEQDSESESPRLFDVFEGHYFHSSRSLNKVSPPDFAFDVDIGSKVDARGSFPNEKQAQRNYGKIHVFDMSWSSGSSDSIHASLLDLKQLLLLTRYLGRSSSETHFFHFSGYGFGSLQERLCAVGSGYSDQEFLTNGIDGAICFWEAKHKQSQSQRQRPAQNVTELNAEMESSNYYNKAGAPFINQSRPTQAFTIQDR